MTWRARRRPVRLGLCLAALIVLAGFPMPADAVIGSPTSVEIRVLSNRADLVSSGDVLLEVRIPEEHSMSALRVALGARDVTSAFELRPGGRVAGLVSGLAPGPNIVTAQVGQEAARLTVVNHDL